MQYDLGERRVRLIGGGQYLAPGAVIIGSVTLHPGASVWFGAVIRADHGPIVIGENSNIQDGAVLHTDEGLGLTVGRGVTVGHRAVLHGCTVGNDSLVGIGALVLNRAVIGAGCLVGAGALVTEGMVIPDGSLVLGVPGRVVRPLTVTELETIRRSAEHYCRNAALFLESLTVRPEIL